MNLLKQCVKFSSALLSTPLPEHPIAVYCIMNSFCFRLLKEMIRIVKRADKCYHPQGNDVDGTLKWGLLVFLRSTAWYSS